MRATGYGTRGQRVAKTVGAAVTHYVYDLGGNLIAEADGGTGAATAEYVWLDGMPLAYIQGGAVYFVHPDHLSTPQRITDAAAAVVWDADYRPFGEATVTGALTFNLRFPGQYYDAETGLHYNTFRDYDTSTGRYIQSDPIGLQGGWNAYAYVGGNPVMLVDRFGELATTKNFGPEDRKKVDYAIQRAVRELEDCFAKNPVDCPIDKTELEEITRIIENTTYNYEDGWWNKNIVYRNACGYVSGPGGGIGDGVGGTINITEKGMKGGCCGLAVTIAHEAAHLMGQEHPAPYDLTEFCMNCAASTD